MRFGFNSITLSILLLVISASVHGKNTSDSSKIFEINKKIGRGVNIIGYDPIWNNFEGGRFKEKHFGLIKDGGFQTIRINLHAFEHMDNTTLKLPDRWFKTLDWAVNNAIKNDLMVIIDLHNFVDFAKDPVGLYPKFIAFWEQVAEHYYNSPENVVFEILNEPNGGVTPELWNKYYPEALKIIRKNNPERAVIIGPPFWNGIHHLNKLILPEYDDNIIVTVHYYLPMEFTHQGAPWSDAYVKLSGVKWGTEQEMQNVINDFTMVQKWAAEHNKPIHLGEFGAYDKGDIESRVKYTNHVARTAESLGWSWSYWQFDSDFIVYDIDNDKWNEPIWHALTK